MFALVGQRHEDDLYESLASYDLGHTDEDLLRTLRDLGIDEADYRLRSQADYHKDYRFTSTPNLPSVTWNDPIVIYEEPLSLQPITALDEHNGYVWTYKEPVTEENTYETINFSQSEAEDAVPVQKTLMDKPMKCQYEKRRAVSQSSLTSQPVPVSCQSCFQNRMEAIAKKVSFLKGRGELSDTSLDQLVIVNRATNRPQFYRKVFNI